MANTLRIKRRSSSGAAGVDGLTLQNAELAFNEADDTLYYGKGTGGAGGTATNIIAIAGYGAYTTIGTEQTITGNKTFSGTIAVSTPSANTHATTKLYVDNLIANVNSNIAAVATSFTVAGDTGSSQTIVSGTDTLTISGGTGLSSVAGATDKITINLNNTAVTAGSYGNANTAVTLTVDAQGRLTAASQSAIAIYASQITDLSSNTVTSLTGTANEISVSASSGAIALSLPSNVTIPNNLTVTGDLLVQGNTTTLNTSTLAVEDKNIVIANGSTTDAAADGAGITIKGATDKTLSWIDGTDAWTASEHIDLASNKNYMINGAIVLSNTTLGSGVVNSSLTSLGVVNTGTWNAGTIGISYGGTGATTAANARINLGLEIGVNVQAYDEELAALAGLTSATDKLPYFTGVNTAALTTLTSFGRSLIDDADASAARTTLGLGTIAIQSASSVSITGGSITNLTTFDGIVIDGGVF